MLFNKFLKDRRSVREYKDKEVSKDKIKRLMHYAEEIEQSYGMDKIKFVLFEDGDKVFNELNGIAGYAGVMIRSPHYIGLQIQSDDKDSVIRGAYGTESLITKAYQLELGTCWISLKNVSDEIKSQFTTGKGRKMDYMIAVGYPMEHNPYKPAPTSSRLAVEEIVFDNEFGKKMDLDELDKRGLTDVFYYVRFAPSNMNTQPWRFIIRNDNVELAIIDPQKRENLTDAGIVMYYFERMAHDAGINSTWKFLSSGNQEYKDIMYSIVGKFKI